MQLSEETWIKDIEQLKRREWCDAYVLSWLITLFVFCLTVNINTSFCIGVTLLLFLPYRKLKRTDFLYDFISAIQFPGMLNLSVDLILPYLWWCVNDYFKKNVILLFSQKSRIAFVQIAKHTMRDEMMGFSERKESAVFQELPNTILALASASLPSPTVTAFHSASEPPK